MKRKLISFEAFRNLEENSLTRAENELVQAEDVLGKALGIDVELHCFNESEATYKTADDNYIHAIYKIENDHVLFENMQELVIDEESSKKSARQAISEMVDAIIDSKEAVADEKFDEYFSMPNVRKELNEGKRLIFKLSKPKGRSPLKNKVQTSKTIAARKLGMKKARRLRTGSQKKARALLLAKAHKALGKQSKGSRKRVYIRTAAAMKEWSNLCENVYGYIEFKNFGHVVRESTIVPDSNGNIIGIAIPTMRKRNEGKILSLGYKTPDTELKILRGTAKKINEDQSFVRAIAELKRYNNVSDNSALEETLENVVSKWPSVLCLTQGELTSTVAEALEIANVRNYDDSTCQFIAEAILRTAHSAYTDRVRKIGNMAGSRTDITAECKTCKDSYAEFQKVASGFFSKLDENDNIDMKVFSDLYRALHQIHKNAAGANDEVTKVETASLMSDCESVLNRASQPSLELAEAISDYISDIIEGNLDNSGEWSDSEVHTSVGGEHPRTSWNAKQTDAVPSKFNGNDEYGVNRAPVSDGKDFGGEEEMMHQAFSNIGGEDVWPSLSNPYIPSPLEFTMKGEKGADKDNDDLGTNQSDDTWPNLSNPMHPKRETAKMTESWTLDGMGKLQGDENSPLIKARKEIMDTKKLLRTIANSPGGEEGAKYIKSGLKAKLDGLGYDWKRCPHALEVLE